MSSEEIEKQASKQLADIAGEMMRENKNKRRWRLFFLLIFLTYFIGLGYIALSESNILDKALEKKSSFVAEVVLSGTVAIDGDINYDNSAELLEEAFAEPNAEAIILRLNSSGGSPVQAHRIYNTINRLKAHFKKKVYVVIEDICASACYLIASSADEIYADKSSIVGSIGVIISSFGVTEAAKKMGIERRVYTAGKFKNLLDPFDVENEAVNKHINDEILQKSHQAFIDDVKKGRGNRLKLDTPDLFSGLFWLGEKSHKIGLIDGIGDSYVVANDVIGIKDRVLFKQKKTLLEELIESSVRNVVMLTSPNFSLK